MEKQCFYIEPAALHIDSSEYVSEDEMLDFLNDFEQMLCVLGDNQCKFIIDNIISASLIDTAGAFLIPAKLSDIRSKSLRARLNKVQQEFFSIVTPLVSVIKTEACSIVGNDVRILPPINERLLEKKYYDDFFYSVLGECYRKNDISSEKILTISSVSKIKGNLISICCRCQSNKFTKLLECVCYDSLISEEEQARTELRKILSDPSHQSISKEQIKVVQAAHEPVVANTIIDRYDKIPTNLRRIWDIFLLFGMTQLDIREWNPPSDKKGIKGSILKCVLIERQPNGKSDIIEGWWRTEDRPIKVEMYFPVGVGLPLITILGDNFYFNDVVALKNDMI